MLVRHVQTKPCAFLLLESQTRTWCEPESQYVKENADNSNHIPLPLFHALYPGRHVSGYLNYIYPNSSALSRDLRLSPHDLSKNVGIGAVLFLVPEPWCQG